jgi:adhesin HecA-like repeat protein
MRTLGWRATLRRGQSGRGWRAQTRRSASLRTFSLLLVLAMGCGTSRPAGDLPELHPARGVVTRGGKPISGGALRLKAVASADNNLRVTGLVGADGAFEFSTMHALSQRKAPGAPAGEYTVTYIPPGETQSVKPIAVPGRVTIKSGENDLTLKLDGR